VPIGGTSITNDLAIGLKTDPEVAEEVKVKHGCALSHSESEGVSVKHDGEIHTFKTEEINEIVEARLEEIFEGIQLHLKKAGRAGKLPSGVVLVGGGSKLKHMAEYAKETLGLAARLGQPSGFGGVADDIDKSEFATAIGLMLIDAEQTSHDKPRGGGSKFKAPSTKDLKGKASKIFGWFKP
jgi:cell division protein FtsA